MLAIQDECVTSVEGIIDNDVDKSIHNLTRIGKDAMDETDKHVLDIILKKWLLKHYKQFVRKLIKQRSFHTKLLV